jgi:hypothetical protein
LTEDKKMISVAEDEYKALLGQVATLKTEKDQLKTQLSDSTEALLVLNEKIKVAQKEEKDAVIAELVHDSRGKLTTESLKDADLDKLYFLKDNLTKAEPKSFVSVMKQREADQNKTPQLDAMGTGTFNQETGKWEGGLRQ